MEAKVDVRKLQVLNDRINQTLDALNQVRLSVHGLGHTGAVPPQLNPLTYLQGQGFQPTQPWGFGAQGMQSGFGGQGVQPGFGGQGGVQSPFQGIPGGIGFGLQHSPYQQYMNPWINPLLAQQLGTPFGQSPGTPFGFGGIGTPGNQGSIGIGQPGQTGGTMGGLFHSTPDVLEQKLVEARASDPYRITQTFPFAVI
jgi:hypothetical protein